MKIIEKLKAKGVQVAASNAVAEALQASATRAILDGINSRAWEAYMRNFTDDPAELARLCGEDGTTDIAYLQVSRAYIARNGLCGVATGTTMDDKVDLRIDADEPQD